MDFSKRVNLYHVCDERGDLVHPRVLPDEFIAVYVENDCLREQHLESMESINKNYGPRKTYGQDWDGTFPHVRAFCYDRESIQFRDPKRATKGVLGMGFQPQIADEIIRILEDQGYVVDKKYR
ncbi:MAG: hypothetical protein QMD85_04115 [Candidatus Aenigmarchaeota archaeon]|nr:hypothetical protein [Candidatus Aenigmarchaeota archaeon]MDI6722747.1 hypothetical protein [Candidatus Aenigmarchaeota archaeon]